jgi:hypothetical protein
MSRLDGAALQADWRAGSARRGVEAQDGLIDQARAGDAGALETLLVPLYEPGLRLAYALPRPLRQIAAGGGKVAQLPRRTGQECVAEHGEGQDRPARGQPGCVRGGS